MFNVYKYTHLFKRYLKKFQVTLCLNSQRYPLNIYLSNIEEDINVFKRNLSSKQGSSATENVQSLDRKQGYLYHFISVKSLKSTQRCEQKQLYKIQNGRNKINKFCSDITLKR